MSALSKSAGKRFWRSIDEYQGSAEFGEMLKAEFPSLFDLWLVDRRELLRVMGASLALAGMTGCKPARSDDVVPFVNRPSGFLEGRTDHYATAVLVDGYAQPVLATTSAGRPIKLDGNPEHPAFRGGSTPFMQAAVLDLYDPDRSQEPLRAGDPMGWADFDAEMTRWRSVWAASGGAGLRILVGATTSPTMIRQFDELQAALPNARVHLFDPLTGYGEGQMRAAFGSPAEWRKNFASADVIVSLDDDFLGPGPAQAIAGRAWGERHGDMPGSDRTRLFAAETTPGLTGAKADRRVGVLPSRMAQLAGALAAEAGAGASVEVKLTAKEAAWLKAAAAALSSARGRSLVTVGRHCEPQLQALALRINQALGNLGRTCQLSAPLGFVPKSGGSFLDLAGDIAAGQVQALFVLDANPVYAAPGELDFSALYRRVPIRVHASTQIDETASLSTWHLPLPNLLEDWSDARSPDGLATIIQPVIQPLYDSRSAHSIVAALTSDQPMAARDLVRQTWGAQLADDAAWTAALKTGFVVMPQSAGPAPGGAAELRSQPALSGDALEIVFRPDPTIRDGRFANNGWLQELPKPLLKTTWDNVVAISPQLAAVDGISTGEVVQVASDGRSIEGPAWVLPGQPDRVVTLFLGYGRSRAGRVGNGRGYDAYPLRPAESPWATFGTLRRTGRTMALATTQEHHMLGAEGEGLIRTVTAEHPSALRESDLEQATLYDPWPEHDPAWGMVIDLDRCIGCNACVTACQAENNVPVVGKDQVAKGREMQWLRVDRYYAGDPEDPETLFQPLPCMHCEQAPCEMGCPVHATVHSPDGVNLMVYNRCIGTRTCSSYCPYKVRRFNWFDYTSSAPESIAMQRNADVTVRGRGVMEKCTYCIQRIEGAKVQADIENRPVRDGEVKTACQQACPAEAISFGNLADRASVVRKQREKPRNYSLLAEQGTRPRTTYLARIARGREGDGE